MRAFLLLVAVTIPAAILPAQGWQTNLANGHQYKLEQQLLSWPEANTFARAQGAHLAVIRSAAENAWLMTTLMPANSEAWIGATRVGAGWQWSTREPFAYSNWDTGAFQPSNGPQEIYARLWTTSLVPGTWDDTLSSSTAWFLMERSAELNLAGAGCAGSNGVPQLDATTLPVLGTTMVMNLTNLPLSPASGFMIGFVGLQQQQVSLASIGMPGCEAWIVPFFDQGLVHTGASTTWPATVPAVLDLQGVHVYLQVFVADAEANALGGTVTNALEAVLW